jgi:hypothetical protein
VSETVQRWQKRAIDLRNKAALTHDAVAQANLRDLAEAWEAMANARQRILDLGGSVPEELDVGATAPMRDVRTIKWGNPATAAHKPKGGANQR